MIPRAGTVHAWITSAAVTKIRISVSMGSATRLSTSNKRYEPLSKSGLCTIYESNSTLEKSVYSYDQYHWCPIALIVREGSLDSSVRYNNRREGIAKNNRIIAGKMVHTVSIYWASKR